MANEYKGLTVQFEGDSTKLTAALSSIGSESRKAQHDLRGVQSALKFDPRSAQLLGEAVKATRTQVEQTTKRIQTLKAAQAEAAKEQEKLANATTDDAEEKKKNEARTQELAAAQERLARELAKAEANLRRDQKALVEASVAATGFGRASSALGDFSSKAGKVSSSLTETGSSLTRSLTMPLAALAVASGKAAIDVDTSLTGVRKTVDMTEEGYQKLKQGALELSKTQPINPNATLNMEALGAQLGWANENLQDFSMTVNGLEISTDMGSEQAATNLAQFANVTNMAQSAASNYASAIVDLGNHLATTESKISDMSLNMASAGAQAGMSQADILGVAAAAASLGLESQSGGSAFSRTINQIGIAVSTNSPKVKQWAELADMSAEQFRSAWKSDVTGTFERVIAGMGDVSKRGGDLNVTLGELGITEIRQSDFLRRMAGNSDLLTDAIARSNSAWDENSALSHEVENRNQSLAAKFEILKNRVVAVAVDVGGPLVDAALSAVDAAQPLIQGVEAAAKAFSSMSKEEQTSILKHIALVAAAGPAISLAGKAVGAVSAVSGGLSAAANVLGTFQVGLKATDSVTQLAAASTGGLAGKLGVLLNPSVQAAGGIGEIAAAAGVAAPAMTGLAVGGIALLVAGIAVLGKAAWDAKKRQDDFSDSVDGMKKSSDGLSSALKPGARAVKDFSNSADEAALSTEQLTDKIREHNETMGKIAKDGSESVSMLGQYQTVIDRLAGAGSASAADMAQLEWAIDGINQATGSSYTTTQVLTGSYQDESGAVHNLKDEIDGLIKKKQEEIAVNAAKQGYTEALKNQMDVQHNLTKAQEAYDDAVASGIKQYEAANLTHERAVEMATANADANEKVGGALRSAKEAAKAADEEVEAWADDLTEATLNTDEFKEGVEKLKEQLKDMELGDIDVDKFAEELARAGTSTEALKNIGTENFQALANSAGGNMQVLAGRVSALNALGLDPKSFTVTDNGTIQLENGLIVDLDNQTIAGKKYELNDDGTIRIAELGIDKVDRKKIGNKNIKIGTNEATAISALQRIQNKVNAMRGKDIEINVYRNSVRGRGPHPAAHGGVRLHAEGASVLIRPTWISDRDIAGEAGPEYYDGTNIVPLSSRYGLPFAGMISEGVYDKLSKDLPQPQLDSVAVGSQIAQSLNGAKVVLDTGEMIGCLVINLKRRADMNVRY